ncbi:MAG TPA: 50S ribosomal protein L17 [Thermodesulfobacteriota bacterium]|nr:50S ribosomal protein L17 [Thermodesulfobacteriota bacterium]
MRHRVAGRKLSRHTRHRELMFRNMVVSLLQHERIKTTLAKGKELRGWADRIISLGKQGTLHARRRAFAFLRDEGIVKRLFDEIAPKFKDREGGYTRIYRLGWRVGDAAPLSLVELATYVPPEEKKKSAIKKAKEVIEKVAPKKREKLEKKEKVEKKEKEKEKAAPKKVKKAEKAEKEAPKPKEKPKKKASVEKTKEKSK